jgi:hypothetical protein
LIEKTGERWMANWITDLPNGSLAARAAALWVATLALGVLVAPVAGLLGGGAGIAASAVAGAACLAGATTALVLCDLLRGPHLALHGILLGMMVRMGLPLGCALIGHFAVPALANAGLLFYLLVFYPVTLAIETALSLPRRKPLSTDSDAPGRAVG